MTQSEREMVRPIGTGKTPAEPQERFTSLQPTYEDSVEPQPESDWAAWDEGRGD